MLLPALKDVCFDSVFVRGYAYVSVSASASALSLLPSVANFSSAYFRVFQCSSVANSSAYVSASASFGGLFFCFACAFHATLRNIYKINKVYFSKKSTF